MTYPFSSESLESIVFVEAVAQTWQSLAYRAADGSSFVDLLSEVFGGVDANRSDFKQAAVTLAERLAAGDRLGLLVELRSAADLDGARGTYAKVGLDGSSAVYVNSEWLASASIGAAKRLLYC